MGYENAAIGNIVIVKNMIFEAGIYGKAHIDHAWKNGRPALIVYSDDEYDYFLAITSNKSPTVLKNLDAFYELTGKDVLYREAKYRYNQNLSKYNFRDSEMVCLTHIYKLPISGHDELRKIKLDTLKNIIKKLKEYHKSDDMQELLDKAVKNR